jgi:hypothetical protein
MLRFPFNAVLNKRFAILNFTCNFVYDATVRYFIPDTVIIFFL